MRRRLVFADRVEAGRLLGEQLAAMELAVPLVLALPRGGVPVGAEIARILRAPLDVTLVRKIGAPRRAGAGRRRGCRGSIAGDRRQ